MENTYLNGKNKWVMALIAWLIGGFGVHNFMLGETKKGIAKIIGTVLCAVPGVILVWIDIIKILIGKYEINTESFF